MDRPSGVTALAKHFPAIAEREVDERGDNKQASENLPLCDFRRRKGANSQRSPESRACNPRH